MASTYLSRTPSGAGNRRTFTYSMWVKTSNTSFQYLAGSINSGNYSQIGFTSNTTIRLFQNTTSVNVETNQLYRDTNGWYHIVVAIDTTQATASNRIKIYVNGIEATYASTTYPSQNLDMNFNEGSVAQGIGARGDGVGYFNGSMSHIHFIDGTAYDATAFGETDSTTGEWKIKTDVSVTYGTNGFFILKDGNSVTDQSGNSNNFTVASGTLTNTEDNPSNVFATMNPLAGYYSGSDFSNGNNTLQTGQSQYSYDVATLGASSGKYYWEVEYDGKTGTAGQYSMIGISSTQSTSTAKYLGIFPHDWSYYVAAGQSYLMNGTSYPSYGTVYLAGDIVGVALDLDNSKLYFSNNGTWQNSGDPTSGATGTGAISITDPDSTPLGAYFPAVSYFDGGNRGTFKANFGNGYFGTTAVASAGTNASGNGIFEYDVPTGFTALSTKGLNL